MLLRAQQASAADGGRRGSAASSSSGCRFLAAETSAALGDDPGTGRPTTLVVAVNADSLATWVLPALAPLTPELCFHLRREDEGRTSDLLRSGDVIAAISSDAEPVTGCIVRPLGRMRYSPGREARVCARLVPGWPGAEALRRARSPLRSR